LPRGSFKGYLWRYQPLFSNGEDCSASSIPSISFTSPCVHHMMSRIGLTRLRRACFLECLHAHPQRIQGEKTSTGVCSEESGLEGQRSQTLEVVHIPVPCHRSTHHSGPSAIPARHSSPTKRVSASLSNRLDESNPPSRHRPHPPCHDSRRHGPTCRIRIATSLECQIVLRQPSIPGVARYLHGTIHSPTNVLNTSPTPPPPPLLFFIPSVAVVV